MRCRAQGSRGRVLWSHGVVLQKPLDFVQCFPVVRNAVSSYPVLMEFLIDMPADAVLLRPSALLLGTP